MNHWWCQEERLARVWHLVAERQRALILFKNCKCLHGGTYIQYTPALQAKSC